MHPPPNLYDSSANIKEGNNGITMGIKLKSVSSLDRSKIPGPNAYSGRSFDRLNKSIIFSK